MTVLQLVGDPDDEPDRTPGSVRAALERIPPLPSPARARAVAWWWATTGLTKLGVLVVRAPYLAVCELRPIAVGFGRIVAAWSRWCAAVGLEAALKAAEQHSEKHAVALEQKKEARRRVSLVLAVVLAAGAWVVAARWPAALVLAGMTLVGVCDAVGRRVAPPRVSVPPPARAVLREGVPLTQVTRTLVEVAEREGLGLGVARAMRYDAARREYRISVTCLDAIETRHLRAFERGLGAADYSIRSLATDEATTRELVIRDGDPLAEVGPPDWIDTGSLTIARPLELGYSMTEVPFALTFAGVHVRVVGGTGAGKTSWFLRTLIDRLSACSDCVIWGCDLTNGPELPLWRSVIQRRAFDPATAEELLDAMLAEIGRRARILAGFAEDDDPSNDDITEWRSSLGPYLVCIVDEFSTVAEFDGKGGKPNLLAKCEQVVRTGRKHGVSLVMLAQKTGNDDFGSSTMSTQCGTSVMLGCSPADTVRMVGVERRDQGYTPHLLAPGVEGDARDAGKCFLDSPRHRTPDIYRCHLPMPAGEVKRRARQRIADGLPSLDGGRPGGGVVEAVEVPPVLAEVERAFADAGHPDQMATAELLVWLRAAGHDLDERRLAEALRPVDLRPAARWRPAPGANSIRGYNLADVRAAMRRLG